MISAIAVTLLAVVIPTDKLDSVAVAEYWFKKDSRGKGDGISELAMPKRYPAFAVAEDEFIVADPFVRERHLDHIEMTFNGERAPAREIARCMEPEVVIIKSEKPFKGVRPLVFRRGDPFERMTWRWSGDNLTVRASAVGTNDMTSVVVSSGRAFRQGEANSLYVDRNRNPVWLDMGFRHEVQGARFVYPSPLEWTRLDAHVFENAAVGMEKLLSNASVGVLIRLDSESKEDSGRGNGFIIRCGDSQLERNQVDAVGYAIEDRIIVPTLLDGEKIARISRTEATFPDGSVTNLVFAGALAEWNALVFDLPEQFKSKVTPLSIAKDQPESFDNRVAWCATVENENGRVVATVLRQRFRGVDFIRGAAFVPHADGARTSWRSRQSQSMVLDDAGRIALFKLSRRYTADRWSNDEIESVSTEDLCAFLSGTRFNPEFAPRGEESRNRLAWLGAETVRLTDALARERKAQSFIKDYSRPPYIVEIYPGSPADKAGLEAGDVLLAVRRGNEGERPLDSDNDYSSVDWGSFFSRDYPIRPDITPWPEIENPINKLMTGFGAGAQITVIYARDGVRREAPVVLEAAPVHYKNAAKARNRALGLSVRDMTFEVRRYFKFDDDAPGIVIARVKPGSPAAVAGLRMFELVTEVNGEKVTGAKDFAAKTKGKTDLVFAVRRLAQTRMVKIHIDPAQKAEGGVTAP